MEGQGIVRQAWVVLEPELAALGFELIEVEYGAHGSNSVLRLYIDRSEGGVTVDDCAAASRVVSALLDRDDFIGAQYMLEVSSPGIARPLRRPRDFERYAGERIKLKTVSAVDGRKRFTGVLSGFDDGLVTVEIDDRKYRVHVENIKTAHLDR